MFVKSYACKHHIKITNVKIERLQDISDEDCLKEGIVRQEVISDESPFLYAYDAFWTEIINTLLLAGLGVPKKPLLS